MKRFNQTKTALVVAAVVAGVGQANAGVVINQNQTGSSGAHDASDVVQFGAGSGDILINQDGDAGHTAAARQSNIGTNNITIDQDGDDQSNTAGVFQVQTVPTTSTIDVSQNGGNLFARVRTAGEGAVDNDDDIDVTQTGFDQTAFVTSTGSAGQTNSVTQSGEGQTLFLNGTDVLDVTSTITQSGQGNTISAELSSNNKGVTGVGTTSTIDQAGTGNEVIYTAVDDLGSTVSIEQVDDNNVATVGLEGTSSFSATIDQGTEGDGNEATVRAVSQNGVAATGSGSITQTGDNNVGDVRSSGDATLSLTQTDTGNVGNVRSFSGTGVTSTVTQAGDDNEFTSLVTRGDGTTVTGNQTGNDHVATVTITDDEPGAVGTSVSIDQTPVSYTHLTLPTIYSV